MERTCVINDVDITKLDDYELTLLGITLMRKSLNQVLNKDAKEHGDFELYMKELEFRKLITSNHEE